MGERTDDDRRITIGVRWEGAPRFESQEVQFHGRNYIVATSESSPRIQVVDTTGWSDAEGMQAEIRAGRLPCLVLCSPTDEARWLADLALEHEICRAEISERGLALRIVRLHHRQKDLHKLMRRSLVDTLTGVLSRSELGRRVDLEMESVSPENPLALLMADIDHFKAVNDNHGHVAGDRVLRVLARILKACVGDSTAVFRFGGEEFAIVVRMNDTQAGALAEFIRSEIEQNGFDGIEVTLSIGYTVVDAARPLEDLVGQADSALYQAKARGRNRVVNYAEFSADARESGTDPDIRDFENHIRVLTDRLTQALTHRSQKLFSNVRSEADRDGLTGLFNKRYFQNRIRRDFDAAQGGKRPLALAFFDIDHFGQVNKTHGFPTGDRTLKSVTDAIVAKVRPTDWVARYGGEEICVVMPDTTEEDARDVAERIRSAVEELELRNFDEEPFRVTISGGVAAVEERDESQEGFVHRTGRRTLIAKEGGRNRICSSDV